MKIMIVAMPTHRKLILRTFVMVGMHFDHMFKEHCYWNGFCCEEEHG